MSTLRQIEANRRNAQKSTGPTSVTGKAASSMNALKTGIHAKSLVLPSENQAELEELIEDCYQSLRPTTPEARIFVDEFIYCEWSLRRLRAAETESWKYQSDHKYRPRRSTRSDVPPPRTRTLFPNSSTVWMPPVAPANAPSSPSNNSRPKPRLPPRPTHCPNRPNPPPHHP
jgi:hypothetical protein